jgi:hypothetical protein
VTRLAASELLRLWSRRIVWLLGLLAAIGIVVACTIVAVNGHGASEVALANGVDDASPRLADLPAILKGTSFILIVIGLVIGASSVGADWQQGTMATLLTWEPRRVRVFVVRAVTVAVVVAALAIALQVLLSLGIAFVASTRGSVRDTDGAWLGDVVATAGRIAAVVALTAVMGAAIAGIGRHTAAAMGAVFVYLAVVESFLRGLLPGWIPNMLSTAMVILIDGRAQDAGSGDVVTVERSVATILLYAGVLLAVAVGMFRSRDVT